MPETIIKISGDELRAIRLNIMTKAKLRKLTKRIGRSDVSRIEKRIIIRRRPASFKNRCARLYYRSQADYLRAVK